MHQIPKILQVCRAEQRNLIYCFSWCVTGSLKCFHSNKNADTVEAFPSIQIHSLSLQATSITFCFPPKHHSQQQKKRRKVTRRQLSREETLCVRGVRTGLFPREALPNRSSTYSKRKLDLSRKGSAGVRNLRGAWLFVFWGLSNTSRWESTEVFACEVLKLIRVSCFH